MEPDEKKIRTDWVAWVMYAAVGAVIGIILALVITSDRRMGSPLVPKDFCVEVRIGMTLLCAGICARHGELWWSPASMFRVHPEGFAIGKGGRALSDGLILLGSVSLVISVIRIALS